MSDWETTKRLVDLNEWVLPSSAMNTLGISRAWLRKLRDRGTITARNGGYAWLYYLPSIEAYKRARDEQHAAKEQDHEQ